MANPYGVTYIEKMIPLLVADGFRVIAPDLPGYGKSTNQQAGRLQL